MRQDTTDGGYVLILHEVADYLKWKAVFDAAQAIRRDAGEIDYHLLRHDSDACKIVHFSRWHSLRAARQFFESDVLVRIREEAGVQAPAFFYLHQIEFAAL